MGDTSSRHRSDATIEQLIAGEHAIMREHTFAPRLLARLSRLAFGLCFRGRRLKVEVEPHQARYSLRGGAPLEISHHGEMVKVTAETPVTCATPVQPARDVPTQPPGRAPARRRAE